MEIIFKRSQFEFSKVILAGLALLLISTVMNHHLFYIYYYLFLVGIILFMKAYSRFIVLNDSTIIFYYGIFNNKKFITNWDNISKITLTTYTKSVHFSAGAKLSIPLKGEKEFICLKLELIKALDQSTQNTIKKTNYGFKYTPDTKTITIVSEPHQGFKKLVKKIALYKDIEIKTSTDSMFLKWWKMSTSFILLMVQLSVLIGLLFLIFGTSISWKAFFHY
jgi:hypothetical protein